MNITVIHGEIGSGKTFYVASLVAAKEPKLTVKSVYKKITSERIQSPDKHFSLHRFGGTMVARVGCPAYVRRAVSECSKDLDLIIVCEDRLRLQPIDFSGVGVTCYFEIETRRVLLPFP